MGLTACLSPIIEGLKIEVLTSLLPSVGQKTAKINAIYKQPNVHTVASLDVFKVSSQPLYSARWLICKLVIRGTLKLI
jgi:hypothetical protein